MGEQVVLVQKGLVQNKLIDQVIQFRKERKEKVI
jgi:hypothetical protein